MKKLLFTLFLFLLSLTCSAQLAQYRFSNVQTDSAKMVEYKEKIGLDMAVADFSTKAVDAKVMGPRLANIINSLLDNYLQIAYEKQICLILKEQVPALDKMNIHLKKISFAGATKRSDDIILKFTVWLEKNDAKIKRTNLSFIFTDGVSESMLTNELFVDLSKYVQAREESHDLLIGEQSISNK